MEAGVEIGHEGQRGKIHFNVMKRKIVLAVQGFWVKAEIGRAFVKSL